MVGVCLWRSPKRGWAREARRGARGRRPGAHPRPPPPHLALRLLPRSAHPPGRSGRRLLLLLGSGGSRGELRAQVAGLRGRLDTARDAKARPGSAGAVRWTGDSASEPGARPARAPPTPRRRHPLLPRARRSRSPGPTPHPPAFPAALPLAVLEGPQPARPGKPGTPRRDALRRLRGIPGALLLPAVGSPAPAPARPDPGPAARLGNWARRDRS